MEFNKYQSSLEELGIYNENQEIQDQFFDAINSIPYIRKLISPNRLYAKDIPKDNSGKIIVDITDPHIIEDTDYFRPSALYYKKHGCYTKLRPNPNPNSEFGKWIKEEVRRCFEGYVRESDGEWITGDMYFFLNYCPIQLTKKDEEGKDIRVIDFPNFWDGHYYKFHYLNQCRSNGKHAMELASRGKGKAHPYSQKVFTPEGWKLWKDISIGDYLYGDDGQITRVIDIPYDEMSDIYRVTLKDGREIYCTSGHLFKVRNNYKKVIIKSLEEIKKDYIMPRKPSKHNKGVEYKYKIPVNKGIDIREQNVPIDPYTLGLLIGDGCFRTTKNKNYVTYTSRKEDMDIYKKVIPYTVDKITNDNYTYAIRVSILPLMELGLWNTKSQDKFIPKEYLYNSKEVRLNILRGLMDSDGEVESNGIPLFNTTSERLKDDFVFLCRSLGYNVSVKSHKSNFNGKEYTPHYRIRVFTNDHIFNLPRKLDRLTSFSTEYSKSNKEGTTIVKIEFSHKEWAKCVTVDNESHCYLVGDFVVTHNSYVGASLLAKRFILGESKDVIKKVQCVVTASEKKYIQGANQILDMFQYYIDFSANNTQFPSRRITSSLNDLKWTMGYIDVNTGTRKGSENSVIGITSKDDESKLRGSRGVLYLLEEAGSFPRLLNLYQVIRPSVEDGKAVWGMIYGYGTSGDSESDFSSMQELMYNPKGYNILGVKNIYDKEGQGRKLFTYFFPGYLNRADCYDSEGNSNVTKALLEIIKDRYTVKYNSSDINAITKRIAEIPLTPQEAIIRTKGNIFPVTDLSNRLNQLDNNPNEYNDVYTGSLVYGKNNQVEFMPTNDIPIREFPLKDNKAKGAVEIFKMPEKNSEGKVFQNRYILSFDPIDFDASNTMSLASIFVLDLWTDKIVAEYTGRQDFADDNYEILRRLCMFYNGKCLYENNLKGTFAYFSKMNCLYLLADTPEYLRDKDLIKSIGYGNLSKGVTATKVINDYANTLIRNWFLLPKPTVTEVDGEKVETEIYNLYFIRNRALLKEAILYNPDINVDRIRSLGLLMLFREQYMVIYNGDVQGSQQKVSKNHLSNDSFFTKNYNLKFNKPVNLI